MRVDKKPKWRGWDPWQTLVLFGCMLVLLMEARNIPSYLAVLGLVILWSGERWGFYLLVAHSLGAFLAGYLFGYGVPALGGLGLFLLFAVISNRWKDLRPPRRVAIEAVKEGQVVEP